jgi:PAS domain S-box-containing protein
MSTSTVQTQSAAATTATRILIVEDEAVIAMDMARQLREFGYEVVGVAASSQRARELALQTRPDLVMMDIVIKGPLDGIETARAIRRELDTAVVFLTAYSDPGTIERAKAVAPLGYLTKPFRPQELRSTIEVAFHQHQLERRARESEQWLVKTLQCIGDGVLATDPAGCIRLINPVACALLGVTTEQVQGQRAGEAFRLFDDLTHAPLNDLVAQVLESREPAALVRGLLHDARGEPAIYVDAGATPIRGDEHGLLGVVLVFRDVTRRRLDEIELLRYRDHLEQLVNERTASLTAAKSEAERANLAKSEFLSLMSHELRTPMNAVLGFSDLLRHEKLSSSQRTFVDHIHNAGGHLLGLIDDLLDMTTVSAGHLRVESGRVELAPVIDQLRTIVGPMAAQRQVRLAIEPARAGLAVMADPKRLLQVLVNLVSNAVKYNRAGGRVELRCDVSAGREVRIEVIDDGMGIDQARQALIFRPFERLGAESSGVQGTGLGLALSKSLVELMGGKLGFNSELGHGSTFWCEFPVAE